MKTVFSKVIEEDIVTEDGQLVDAIFGMKSIEARIVESPVIVGTTSTLLKILGQRAIDIYRGRLKPEKV